MTYIEEYGILKVMKFSKSLIGTLRQDPREAESRSHRILLRGGFIRQLDALLGEHFDRRLVVVEETEVPSFTLYLITSEAAAH